MGAPAYLLELELLHSRLIRCYGGALDADIYLLSDVGGEEGLAVLSLDVRRW